MEVGGHEPAKDWTQPENPMLRPFIHNKCRSKGTNGIQTSSGAWKLSFSTEKKKRETDKYYYHLIEVDLVSSSPKSSQAFFYVSQ